MTRRFMTLTSMTASAILLVTAHAPVDAQQRSQGTAAPRIYSEAQAVRGELLYADNCSYCHLVDLSGGDLSPALTGAPFIVKWTSRPLSEVFDYMRTQMPLNSVGGLSGQQNADILAFLLKRAGLPAGTADLPAASAALRGVILQP
jgi:mono/diheme cytochrome c family protein